MSDEVLSVVDVATVVTDDDVMWGVFDNTPQSYIDKLNTSVGDSFKQEFSDLAQVSEVVSRLKANGYDVSRVLVDDDGPSYSFPPLRRLVYLRANGPKLYTLRGTVIMPDSTVTPINQGVGYFINNTRLIAKGQFASQPFGVEFGDKVGVSFFDGNVNRPTLVWTK
jgi:hypothetical protein